jgi:hypothetical protein
MGEDMEINAPAGRGPGTDDADARLAVPDAEIRGIVRAVRDEMNGQPADRVYAELFKRMPARSTGLTKRNLLAIAKDIESETL